MAAAMGRAINTALADAVEDDPRVLVFGEDVGRPGEVFRVTDGLQTRFGEQRCFDTPLAESGIVGTAIGLAAYGRWPLPEIQFDGFSNPAFEQIVSHVPKLPNRSRGTARLPVAIRIPYGGGIGAVGHHSESPESHWAHTAGLKVLTPGTPEDGHALMRAAIEDDDPIIFLEPKRSCWMKTDSDLPVDTEPVPQVVVRREEFGAALICHGRWYGLRWTRPRWRQRSAGRWRCSTCARSPRSTPPHRLPASTAPVGLS